MQFIKKYIFVCIVFFPFFLTQAMANAPLQVAVIPFTVNAEKEYAYLQNGITEMLTFHLSKQGNVKVLGSPDIAEAMKDIQGPLTDEKVEEIGRNLKIDCIIYGSVSIFGNHAIVQGKALDVKRVREPVLLSRELPSIDGIIPEINGFAEEIQTVMINDILQPADSKNAQESRKDIKADSSSAIIVHHDTKMQNRTDFWRSEPIETLIYSLAVGDINNDGKKDILLLSPHAIDMYHIQESKLVKEKRIFSDDGLNFISIDIADINQNGFAEIFVTSLNALNNTVTSFVIEYKEGVFAKVVENFSYYFKVVEHPSLGQQLLGQQQKTGRSDIYSGAIVRMAWKNNRYEAADSILPENFSNLLGFTYGRLMNTDNDACVFVASAGSLKATDSMGNQTWSGNASYAKLPIYFKLPKEEPGVENRQYYPMRIKINTVGGYNELIVSKNPTFSGSLLSFFSSNDKAHIESLAWDGIGFVSNWETRDISGTFTDFVIDDVDQDGKKELLAGLIVETGTTVGGHPKSVLVSYDLERTRD